MTAAPDVALRPPDERDVDWISEACQDPDIVRWTTVPSPYTRADAEQWVRSGGRGLEPRVIVDASTDQGLGVCGIKSLDTFTGEAEIGYWVAPWARGRGVAPEAVRRLVERSRDLGATSAVLLISPGNDASVAVAERAGFVLAERRSGGCFDGHDATDTLVYRRVIDGVSC